MARFSAVLCCAAALLLMAGSAAAVGSCWQGTVTYMDGQTPVWNPPAKTVSGTYAACWFGQGTFIMTKNGTSMATGVRALAPSATIACSQVNAETAYQIFKDSLIAYGNNNNFTISEPKLVAACCTSDNCNGPDYNAGSLLRPSVVVLLLALLSVLSLRQAL